MKVALDDFKAALALFESEFVDTFKSSLHKFIMGAAVAGMQPQIDALLEKFTVNGFIDVDSIKNVIDAGMKSCGGQFEIPLSFGVLASIGATPVDIRIKLDDVEKFFGTTLPAVSKRSSKES